MRTRADVVAWLDAVVDGLRIERAAFAGHSYGAWMATTYALVRPDLVDRLALLAPAGVFVRVKSAWLARAITTYVVRPTPGRVRRFMASTCAPATEAAFGSSALVAWSTSTSLAHRLSAGRPVKPSPAPMTATRRRRS